MNYLSIMPTQRSAAAQELLDFAAKLLAEIEYWRGHVWEPAIPEPGDQPKPDHYRLQWYPPEKTIIEPTMSIEEARALIYQRMNDYAYEKRPGRMLLVTAQPGVGKTHAAVKLAQELALDGMRVFFAMMTHEHYNTLSNMPHFDNRLWYHWQAYSAPSVVNPGNKFCLYDYAFGQWTAKGYPGMKLCDSLCSAYKVNCEYRKQRLITAPIIAGTHDHISLGMGISDFDVAIVDEIPIRAFLKSRYIPRDKIALDGIGPVRELAEFLSSHPMAPKETLQGKALLDIIGPYLHDVYAQFEDYKSAIPQIPWITRTGDVENVPYWYLPDFLTLMVQELAAWEAGQTDWLSRVIVTNESLILLKRSDPWAELPVRLIALDATGNKEAYEQLFNRKAEKLAPSVQRKGTVRQIVYRLNGISTMTKTIGLDGKRNKVRELADDGQEALELCQALTEKYRYQRPGVVTFLGAERAYGEAFNERVLHFFGQRGSNALKEVDALFVVGCPQPSDTAIMEQVRILYAKRMRPFAKVDGSPARSEKEMPYGFINKDGFQAHRMITGFWQDTDLQTIASVYREDELVQAIHRARPISRECDIWLLTSIPTNEILTEIFDTPNDVFGSPIPNWRAWLKILKLKDFCRWRNVDLTKEMIRDATGLSYTTLSKYKILEKIMEKDQGKWEVKAIAPVGGRGRPTQGLTPLQEIASTPPPAAITGLTLRTPGRLT